MTAIDNHSYGFDSYNQTLACEISQTIRAVEGGDTFPKVVICSSGGGIAETLDASYWKGCGSRGGHEREFIVMGYRDDNG